jgi:FkbM family methyltransferase
MFQFFQKPKRSKHFFTSKTGKKYPVLCRDGTSDWNTITAALEQDEYHLYSHALKPGQTAIDIGSHIGGVSLLLAGMGLQVYSIEALPDNVRLQKKNLALNGFSRNVRVLHRAIAGETGKHAEIYYGSTAEEVGRHHEFIGTSAAFPHFFAKGRFAVVETISVDEIFNQFQIDHCALLKIDVEGAEWETMGAVSSRTWDKIDIFLGEWHCFGNFKSRRQMLDLTQGKFEDVSEAFGAPSNDFVFKRKKSGVGIARL